MYRRICLGQVPILTFHSVRRRHTEELGVGGDLTMPDDVFDGLLASLAGAGYRGITCAELFAHLRDGAALPAKPVLLTFDDGYLDNHTFVGPLLRRHGLCGTVFVATDFLDADEGALRPTVDDTEAPPERGYLSPAEMRYWERDGALEFQSHTASHSRVAVSSEVEDFHRPDEPCLWLQRSRAPEGALAREHDGGLDDSLPWGAPVYRSHWFAPGRAHSPDPRREAALTEHVAANGGAAFFDRPDWRAQLEGLVRAGTWSAGENESEDARAERVVADFRRSKARLEEILEREVPFLAWPGGGSSADAVDWALEEAGFAATFGTNRKCAGVDRDLRAIPRCYLRQDYRGRLARGLRIAYGRGIADWEGGRLGGYVRIFLGNRLMNLLKQEDAPNGRGDS